MVTQEQITEAIARYNLKPTTQFTAEQLAIKHLTYQGNRKFERSASSYKPGRSHSHSDGNSPW
jgi:hypothetical protein